MGTLENKTFLCYVIMLKWVVQENLLSSTFVKSFLFLVFFIMFTLIKRILRDSLSIIHWYGLYIVRHKLRRIPLWLVRSQDRYSNIDCERCDMGPFS